MENPVQTRSEQNGLNYFPTVKEAFEAAKKDPTIWKISFNRENERIRLVKVDPGAWMHESIYGSY